MLVEPVLCSCTVGHITACDSRHDIDIHLAHRRLGPKSDQRENNSHPCAQRTSHPFSVVFHTCRIQEMTDVHQGREVQGFASARPLGHGISQSFHTKVLEEFVLKASPAVTAHEISTPSVRKFQKGSFWRLREGIRPRHFPTFPSESVARIRF